ncbi:hypothetical protein BH10PAT3_BH10PAT3_5350 [soil metagenome]
MTNSVIAILIAISAGVWIYSKLMRSTGNNLTSAITVASIAGAVIFVVALLLLRLIPA